MNRGELWWAEVGNKRRPVLVLTRSEVIDVRELVTVAEITSTIRGLAVEVPVGETASNLTDDSVVNCDGLHTIRRSSLTTLAGEFSEETMRSVCNAVAFALGC
ncbi:type II toxin-antitoxin system PemK/MazF family toxin [Candidatus Poriferisodalis sp.]|uniref:type II toxin-antitoxin system PemK/MazF family toxin n=1 Tax=Candidatus Poriferisodalis sp. TaxID=3101277 RepID=UPI003C6F961F